jgi:hypothetical protein
MTEILNQCAHAERVIDALDWAIAHGATQALECHPTQTHGEYDLLTQTGTAFQAFEVSDVASTRDGNGKLATDLRSLAKTGKAPPSTTFYLVVSDFWATTLPPCQDPNLTALVQRLAPLGQIGTRGTGLWQA